ncbi:MAG TPA: hypothetical protein VHN36_10560 [Ilumatobacteraceae bacterium]|nr:hypothetical protein [Ilumatobacteraceae bacterium]
MTRWRALVMVCVWLVLSVSLAATNAQPAVLVLAGIVAVVSAVILVMFDLSNAVIRVGWTRPRQVRRSTRGSDPRVSSLRTELYDARWFGSAELRGTLVDLVDDRLLAHRHIDRATDPAAAMEALTPILRHLVAAQRPAAAVRQLGRIITDIESL